ncbi:MAG: aromatic amino acid transport family protein [bacterium]
MKLATKNYLRGISLMIGMIIGVGLFGVPFVIAKSGALIGLGYFLILSVIIIFNHLIYGETILRTKGQHRLAGLANIYLGKWWKRLSVVASTLGFYAVIIAYIILGGAFLHILLSPFFGGAVIVYQIAFFAIMAAIILIGLRTILFSEFLMTGALLLVIIFITAVAGVKINFSNFLNVNVGEFFTPYGVILFSITGAAAVPEVLEIMSRDKRGAKSVIFWGSFIPILLIALFAFVVVGVTGAATTKDAIAGLGTVFGNWILYVGAFFGLFAVATSFLPLALYAKKQFHLDFKVNGFLSWALACLVPFAIFLFGTKDFITIISFSGAVFSGFEAFLVIWIYSRARRLGERKPEYSVRLPLAFLALMGVMFILGMIYEVSSFFR